MASCISRSIDASGPKTGPSTRRPVGQAAAPCATWLDTFVNRLSSEGRPAGHDAARSACCCAERQRRTNPMEKRAIGALGTDPPLAPACPAQRLCRRAPLWLVECGRRPRPAPRPLPSGPRAGEQTARPYFTLAVPMLSQADAFAGHIRPVRGPPLSHTSALYFAA